MTEKTKVVKMIWRLSLGVYRTENEMIRKDLLDEALCCAVTIGMRKTSVEQLTHSCRLQIPFRYQSYDLHRKQCGVFAVADTV